RRQLTPLQVVRRRKRLPRAGAPASLAAEAWDPGIRKLRLVGAKALEAPSLGVSVMSRAFWPRTMRWIEPERALTLDGVSAPAHDPEKGKRYAGPWSTEFRVFIVRRASTSSAEASA